MKFTSSENEISNAIDILDKLINANTSNTMETIRRYKTVQEIDMFTSFRLRRELKKISEKL